MKKGFSGIVLSLLLVLSMGTTVYADTFPSPGNTTGLDKVAEEWNSKIDGNISALNENNVSVTVKKDKPTAAEVTEANEEVKKIGNTEILGMSNLSVSDSSAITSKGLTVTLKVPGVKPTDKVYILHKVKSGWERLKATAGNGTVTTTMYSFSPVVVIRYHGTGELSVSDPSKNTGTGSNGGTESSNTAGGNQSNSQPNNNNQNSSQSNSQPNNNNQNSSQSNSQPNNNNQNSSQSNPQNNSQSNSQNNSQSQNNPVSVNQNVTLNYPTANSRETGGKGVNQTGSGAQIAGYTKPVGAFYGVGGGVSYATAPKTGSSMPALWILAVLVLTGGIAFCGKKAKSH